MLHLKIIKNSLKSETKPAIIENNQINHNEEQVKLPNFNYWIIWFKFLIHLLKQYDQSFPFVDTVNKNKREEKVKLIILFSKNWIELSIL